MLRLNPRKIIQYSIDDLWNLLTGKFILAMDDGDVETNYRDVLFSAYTWEIHKRFNKLPFYKRHLVSSVLKNKSLDNNSHIKLLSNIHKDLLEVYQITDTKEIFEIAKLYYPITNNLYNGLVAHVSEYVTGMDILDFIEVHEYPPIKKAVTNVQPNSESIKDVYKTILKEVSTSEVLKDNALVKSLKSGLIRVNNFQQVIGPRGYLNDIDGTIFPNPILTGYLKGLTDLHASFIESRSASRALFFSKGQLEDAEYFARRLQLETMTVERVHVGDCGSQKYLSWTLLKESDLKLMVGIYYLNEDTNTLEYIKDKDKHLIGKTLKIRSPIAGCAHPDPHGVCSTCMGRLYINSLPDTNLGHNVAVTQTKDQSQKIISTKHFEESSSGMDIGFNEVASKYLLTKPKSLEVYLHKQRYHSRFNIHIDVFKCRGLLDIDQIPNVEEVNSSRLTNLDVITIEIDTATEIKFQSIDLDQTSRRPFFTKEFLQYIKDTRSTIDGNLMANKAQLNNEDYVVDCTNWDFSLPVLKYPMKYYNMGDHSRIIAAMIESNRNNIQDRMRPEAPVELLSELFDFVNQKLSVHLSVLSLIVYGAMVRSVEDNDYRLPKVGTTKSLSVLDLVIENRSLSAELAYENQFEVIRRPSSFFKDNRIDHVMDFFVTPYEVAKYHGWC